MSKQGVFSVSLDFELHWGCLEHKPQLNQSAQNYFHNTRNAIPKMLQIFEKYELHVTWAIVGMLFRKNATDWHQNQPSVLPTFKNPAISAYDWVKKNGFFEEQDLFHFAPELIQKIKSTPNQEIGSHTYAHYFCLEEGQTIEQFKEDIRTAFKVANEIGISISSLVFPRNQYNEEYLAVCRELGITSIRSNPAIWYWQPSDKAGLLTKIFRSGDAFCNIHSAPMVFLDQIQTHIQPIQLPATRLYRPWRPTYSFQNKFKLKRILNEMTRAAQEGGYYHLWWHPHNIGNHPKECLEELNIIASHFVALHKKYDFQSQTMNETTQYLVKKNMQTHN